MLVHTGGSQFSGFLIFFRPVTRYGETAYSTQGQDGKQVQEFATLISEPNKLLSGLYYLS